MTYLASHIFFWDLVNIELGNILFLKKDIPVKCFGNIFLCPCSYSVLHSIRSLVWLQITVILEAPTVFVPCKHVVSWPFKLIDAWKAQRIHFFVFGKIALLLGEIHLASNFNISLFTCLNLRLVIYILITLHEPWKLEPNITISEKNSQRIFCSFLRIAFFAKPEFLSGNDGSCQRWQKRATCHWWQLPLSSSVSEWWNHYVPTCESSVSFLSSVLCFYLHIDKITYSIYIMCKMKKYLLVETWFKRMPIDGCRFFFL